MVHFCCPSLRYAFTSPRILRNVQKCNWKLEQPHYEAAWRTVPVWSNPLSSGHKRVSSNSFLLIASHPNANTSTFAYRLFSESADIYGPIILGKLIYCVPVLAILGFTFNLVSLAIIFTFCYYGDKAADSFEEMYDSLRIELDWQRLPLRLKKYTVLMMANMQQPLLYHGYVVNLDLNRFLCVSGIIFNLFLWSQLAEACNFYSFHFQI